MLRNDRRASSRSSATICRSMSSMDRASIPARRNGSALSSDTRSADHEVHEHAADRRTRPRPMTSCRSTASTTSSSTSATRCRPRPTGSARSGFKEVAYAGLETGVRDRASHVLEQGRIRIVLTGALVPGHEIGAHVARHGDGVKVIALGVPGRRPRLPRGDRRAARAGSQEPHDVTDDDGTVRLASIATYGDTLHTFVDRSRLHGRLHARLRAARPPRPTTPACWRSTTSSATSSSATWTSGSSTTRTSSGCARCCTSPTTTSRPSTPR